MIKLKDRPIAVQIWIILGLVLGTAFAVPMLLFPFVLRASFTAEVYARIEESQEYILSYGDLERVDEPLLEPPHDRRFAPPQPRVVRHLRLKGLGDLEDKRLPSEILASIVQDARDQQELLKRYSKEFSQMRMFYIIRRLPEDGKNSYLISFLWERPMNDLVSDTFGRLIQLLGFVLFISWVASIFIAKRISRPLVQLESKVKEIAVRNWDDPVSLDRGDEIGRLGQAIEWMRRQLVEHDHQKQSFLQQVSHELKTPIMVIRSYAQAISDGISLPGGSLQGSVKVIEEETERLEKRVHTLLNDTKYDYLATHRLEMKEFDLVDLINKTVPGFMWRKTEIDWELKLENSVITGDLEKLRIALENIFDNQVRYARQQISVSLTRSQDANDPNLLMRVWNDGPEVGAELMQTLFDRYKKGDNGEFGLGLAIAKLIIDLHQGAIWASNEDGGVAFYIRLKS